MIVKRCEKGDEWVELHLDDRRARFWEVTASGKVPHPDCNGNWFECEGDFQERMKELVAAGFVVVNNFCR